MEIVVFKEKKWDEIPEQDNPTFDYVNSEGDRRSPCLLICKVLPYKAKCVGGNGYSVIEIPKKGEIISKGLFWNIENAELFAKALQKHLTQQTQE